MKNKLFLQEYVKNVQEESIFGAVMVAMMQMNVNAIYQMNTKGETMKEDLYILKSEATVLSKKEFRAKILDLLKKKGMILPKAEIVDLALKTYFDERIKEFERKTFEKDPLDEIFFSKRETKMLKRIKELESVNEHLRQIYKRDIKIR